jgi:hypothetical protein
MFENQPLFANIMRYRMIDHRKAQSNPDRDWLYEKGKNRFRIDGLVNLRYHKLNLQFKPLYTHILVDIQKTV